MRPLLALFFAIAPIASAADPPPAAGAVAVVDGQPISAAALETAIGNRLVRLRAQEYQVERRTLDEMVAGMLLEREAKARGVGVDALLREEVENRVPEIADARVEQAWLTARGPIKQLSKEEGKKKIAAGMREVEVRQRREEFVAALAERANVRVLLEPPRMTVDANTRFAAGPPDAPVTIVEFGDFQCPFCAKAGVTLRDVTLRYGNKVRLVYRHLPLPIHPNAQKAAEAAACAGEQGSFWEMGEWMLRNQQSLDVASLKEHAVSLKLDPGQFDRCLDSGQFASAIADDKALALSYGIDGTPAIFVNGRWIVEPSLANLIKTVDEELARTAPKTRPTE